MARTWAGTLPRVPEAIRTEINAGPHVYVDTAVMASLSEELRLRIRVSHLWWDVDAKGAQAGEAIFHEEYETYGTEFPSGSSLHLLLVDGEQHAYVLLPQTVNAGHLFNKKEMRKIAPEQMGRLLRAAAESRGDHATEEARLLQVELRFKYTLNLLRREQPVLPQAPRLEAAPRTPERQIPDLGLMTGQVERGAPPPPMSHRLQLNPTPWAVGRLRQPCCRQPSLRPSATRHGTGAVCGFAANEIPLDEHATGQDGTTSVIA
jgi:hypothetical protein